MRIIKTALTVLTLVVFGIGTPGATYAQEETKAIDWRFPVGLTYASGITDVMDALEPRGVSDFTDFTIPVGLSFHPYVEFDFGLGVGLSLGPPSVYAASVEIYNSGTGRWYSDEYISFIIPVGADVRYTFLRDRNVSPYVRAGIRYSIAGGDNLSSSDPGFLGAVGVEFLRTKRVAIGVEVAYDSSQVEVERIRLFGSAPFEKSDVKVHEFMVSVFAVF